MEAPLYVILSLLVFQGMHDAVGASYMLARWRQLHAHPLATVTCSPAGYSNMLPPSPETCKG